MMRHNEGSVRPVIENVKPVISEGRYPVKRVIGDNVKIEATIFVDGHDQLNAWVLYKHSADKAWSRAPMTTLGKRDLWQAEFKLPRLGLFRFKIQAWIDRFGTWQRDLQKKIEAGQDVRIDLLAATEILKKAAKAAEAQKNKKDTQALKHLAKLFENSRKATKIEKRTISSAVSRETTKLLAKYPDLDGAACSDRELEITADPPKAQFSSWYEFFPRSFGNFKECQKFLPYIRSMKFDVVYLPPIHPIGNAFRKGKNNSLQAGPNDPGSPWGIGAKEGGHKAVHPELGSLSDFKDFLKKAKAQGLDVALDIAFQCSPDHPYVKSHPEWFKKRPDGTIQYAENPPKKYQDIYPFNFETKAWKELWRELKSVFEFWCKQGVRIFRVDNPHTKSTRFWAWVIKEIKDQYPDTIFLAEAFTKPAMMYHLAKIGYTQSYTYFTWRNTKKEFKEYLEELTKTEIAQFYRPNFWPNTPDILPVHLQKGGRPAFLTRVALAATLSSNFGLYGPAYELLEHEPLHEGGEEYLNSEKYEKKAWNIESRNSLRSFITKLNKIRRDNRALHVTNNITFIETDNEDVLCYSKQTEDGSNTILVLANLNFEKTQTANVSLPSPSAVVNLLNGKKANWATPKQLFVLKPDSNPVEIYRVNNRRS